MNPTGTLIARTSTVNVDAGIARRPTRRTAKRILISINPATGQVLRKVQAPTVIPAEPFEDGKTPGACRLCRRALGT